MVRIADIEILQFPFIIYFRNILYAYEEIVHLLESDFF